MPSIAPPSSFPPLPSGARPGFELLFRKAATELIRELKACWYDSIAAGTYRAERFFRPFLNYGRAIFTTYATAWSAAGVDEEQLLHLVHGDLIAYVVELIAPRASVPHPPEGAGESSGNSSLWEYYTWYAWHRIPSRDKDPSISQAAIDQMIRFALREDVQFADFRERLSLDLLESADSWRLRLAERKFRDACGPPALEDPRAVPESEKENKGGDVVLISSGAIDQVEDSPGRSKIKRVVDSRHEEYARRLATALRHIEKVKGKSVDGAIVEWMETHPGISKSAVYDYLAGRITKNFSSELRAKVEAAIGDSPRQEPHGGGVE